MPIFDDRITAKLRLPLSPDDPRGKMDRDGHPYIAGHDIKDTLNQVFGFDGWSYEIRELMCISERVIEKTDHKRKDSEGRPLTYRLWELQYNARVRLEVYGIKDSSGRNSIFREDVGNQIAFCSELLPPPHSLAAKGAVTSGLKRAAASLGAQFGLTLLRDDPFGDMPLYADDSAQPERTVPPPPPAQRKETAPPVTAGPDRAQEQGDDGSGAAQSERADQRAAPAASGSTPSTAVDGADSTGTQGSPDRPPAPPTTDELVRDEQREQAEAKVSPSADEVADRIKEFKDKNGSYPSVVERRKLTRSALQAMGPDDLRAIADDIQREQLAR